MSQPVPKVAPWEDVVLRFIAIYKILKAVLAIGAGLTLLTWVNRDLTIFLHQYILWPLHYDLDDESQSKLITWILEKASHLSPHDKRWIAYANFFYAALFLVEGIGLYLKKRWAEYVVIVITGSFIPFEVYLLMHHPVWWKVALILGNVLIIVYLVHRIRLEKHNAAAKKANAEEISPAAPERAVSEVP